jgi:hypothetical protein
MEILQHSLRNGYLEVNFSSFFTSKIRANPIGRPVTMAEAEDRIFGVVLMNDCK